MVLVADATTRSSSLKTIPTITNRRIAKGYPDDTSSVGSSSLKPSSRLAFTATSGLTTPSRMNSETNLIKEFSADFLLSAPELQVWYLSYEAHTCTKHTR